MVIRIKQKKNVVHAISSFYFSMDLSSDTGAFLNPQLLQIAITGCSGGGGGGD